ncbi:ABC transporter substrate-binding protein [Streptomyces sp. AgN23]|uniref:ABC transporter substrate-binding protein n=1 Tax=Streptomyces sp. AgN23 TaxID=1188315 RepID=UPI001B32D5F4|nr:ABC transporter substrate-binding protein [Streptomyces sp. AgN23]QTI87276.1 ABC transporter substrate-binding protein [Streptomyces sp. AgN23]
MKSRLVAALAAVVIVGAGTAACGGTKDDAKDGKGPILIGMPIALSGLASGIDSQWETGARIAVDDINADGGVLGRKLKIITADSKSQASLAGNAAQSLIDKGARFILPTADYDLGSPAARLAQAHGLVSIGLAGDPRWGATGIGDLAFNLNAGSPTEGASAARFAHDKGWSHPYVLGDTSLGYSVAFQKYFTRAWSLIGGAKPTTDTFQNSDTSLATQISRIKAASPAPDVIVLASYPPGGTTALKQLRAAGITTPVIGGNAFDGTFWLTGLPNEKNFYAIGGGVITGTDPDPDRAKVFAAVTKSTGKAPTSGIFPLAGYSAVQAIAKAVTGAKSTDAKAVAARLAGFHDEPLALGPTTWTNSCHVAIGRPSVVIRMARGQETYVTTVDPARVPKSIC